MCGIVGIASLKQLTNRCNTFFQEALYADTLRGEDSTGICLVDKDNGKLDIFKRAMPAYDFLAMKQADRLLVSLLSTKIAIGHNRWATKGVISNRTAHPFCEDNITLVHNGTLKTMYQLDDAGKYAVDSELICHNIAKNGVKDTIEKLNGAYALVWYNSEDDTLNFVRNNERPLSIGYCAKEDLLLWASEAAMLRWVAGRNGILLDNVDQLPVMSHYIFDMSLDAIYKPKIMKYKEYELKKIVTHPGNPGGRSGNGGINQQPSVRKEPPLDLPKTGESIDVYFQTIKQSYSSPTTKENWEGILYDDPWSLVQYFGADINTFEEGIYDVQVFNVIYDYTKNDWIVLVGKPILLEGIDVKGVRDELDEINEKVVEVTSKDVIPFSSYQQVKGPGGRIISPFEFERCVRGGCANCSKDLFVSNAGMITWLDQKTPICEDCKGNLEE